MSKPTRASGKAEVSRRNFLARGAAAGVGAVAIAGTGAQEAAAQNGNGASNGTTSADVVIIGAGVAGLAGRHHGARPRRLGDHRRGELRHRRPRHAERRTRPSRRRPRPAAEVRHQGHAPTRCSSTGCAPTRARAATATAIWCASSPTRTCRPSTSCIENGVEFIEKPIGPGRLDGAAHLRHRGMAHPGRGRSRRGATATAPAWCGGSTRARARRARRSCSSTR